MFGGFNVVVEAAGGAGELGRISGCGLRMC
jgi:hypothetical protein